jgi:hypothetical protein
MLPVPSLLLLATAKLGLRLAPLDGRLKSLRGAHAAMSLLGGRSKLRLPPPAGRSREEGEGGT